MLSLIRLSFVLLSLVTYQPARALNSSESSIAPKDKNLSSCSELFGSDVKACEKAIEADPRLLDKKELRENCFMLDIPWQKALCKRHLELSARQEETHQMNVPKPSASVDGGQESEAAIQQDCEKRWPEDFTMRAACERINRQSLDELTQGKPDDISDDEYRTVEAHCKERWQKNYSMLAACYRSQYSGIRELKESHR